MVFLQQMNCLTIKVEYSRKKQTKQYSITSFQLSDGERKMGKNIGLFVTLGEHIGERWDILD